MDESQWLRDAASTTLPALVNCRARLPRPGELVGAKFRIVRMIGRGGMGAVFEAMHVVMNKRVAIKWLEPALCGRKSARERFLREARATSRISQHPNVVDVYDVGYEGAAMYLVMELLDGETLEALLRRGGLSACEFLGLVEDAVRGVEAAHNEGIVHRDIKPDNIFVVADTTARHGHRAKVLDFGISRLVNEPHRGTPLTAGAAIGTPHYMPIEQLDGEDDVDARADVYAFGILMYRSLTGVLPFDGPTFSAVAAAVATHNPPPVMLLNSTVPKLLNELVMKCIERRRAHRFSDASELLTSLDKVLIGADLSGVIVLGNRSDRVPSQQSGFSVARYGLVLSLVGLLCFLPSPASRGSEDAMLAKLGGSESSPTFSGYATPDNESVPGVNVTGLSHLNPGTRDRVSRSSGDAVSEAVEVPLPVATPHRPDVHVRVIERGSVRLRGHGRFRKASSSDSDPTPRSYAPAAKSPPRQAELQDVAAPVRHRSGGLNSSEL